VKLNTKKIILSCWLDQAEADAFEAWGTEMRCKNVAQAIRDCISYTMKNKTPNNAAEQGATTVV
jgi:hypothetical protein